MSRYNKIGRRLWADSKFRSLSSLRPSGQALWLYLLTSLHTTSIPGVLYLAKKTIEGELNWSKKRLEKCFSELVFEKFLKIDSRNHIIFLVNAFKHNAPCSPNVIKSWSNTFDMIPECDLKDEIFLAMKSSAYKISDAFIEAFDKAFKVKKNERSNGRNSKSLPDGFANPSLIQEQEQEQEQEQDKDKGMNATKKTKKILMREKSIEVLEYLNSKAGREFRPGDVHLGFISARLSDGATVEDCKIVIDVKCLEWAKDEKMQRYLTPETLFNKTKFAKYTDQASFQKKPGVKNFKKIESPGTDWLTKGFDKEGATDAE